MLSLLATCALMQSAPLKTLTIEEALALANRYSPLLKAASASLDGAQAGIFSARAYANPTITFGSLGRQRAIQTTAVPGMVHGFTFNQPVELPSVRETRINAADLGRQSSQYALSETRLAVHGAVKQACYEVLRRTGEVELAQGNRQLLEDLRRRIQVQVKVGEAARLELTRAEAEVAMARIQVQSAELRRSAALSALSASVGAPLGNVEVKAALDPPAILEPLDTLREEVIASHPAIAVAESETRRAQAILENERAQRIPQPTLWADMFQQPDAAQYRFGVTVNLPVWNRRGGPIAEAVAARRRAGAIAEQRRLEITATLERAYNLYQIANQQVEIFEAGTLRQAEAALQAAEAAFRFGARGVIEVLDAQRVLRAARLDYLNAQFDRQEALIELEQLRALDLRRRTP